MSLTRWFRSLFRRPPADPQWGAERLATGTVRAFVDLPDGSFARGVPLPEANASAHRVWFTARADVAGELAARIRGCGEAMGRKA